MVAMDAEISSPRKRNPNGFMTLLSSAVCEWFLIFLLFLDAALSYLLIKFARYCDLQTPCLLCSRFDNGFGEKKPGFYWSLLCSSHREEITSLVSCSIHGNKYGDVHSMCGECLTPIAMDDNKLNPDSYRLLIGKSWVDVDRSVLQSLILNKHMRSSPDVRTCSCCSTSIWRAKPNSERLLDVNHPVGFGASKANVKPPLPRAPGSSRFSRRDSLKRLRDKISGPMAQNQSAVRSTVGSGKMSHVGYTKLKISSDSESEFPISEDDDDGASTDYSQCNRRLKKSPAESDDSQKMMNRGSEVKFSNLDLPKMLDSSQQKNVNSLSSDAQVEHNVRENDDVESCKKPIISFTPELVCLSDGLRSPDTSNSGSPLHMPAISLLSELLSLCTVPPMSSNQGYIEEKDDASEVNHIEAAEETSLDDAHFKTSQIDASSWMDTNLVPSDRNASKPVNTCDSAKFEDDSAQEFTSELGSLSNEASPNSHHKRNKSEVIDIEGESTIDELKRQIENDRNSLNSLYKELEEERNAAASAANEAMAMITRLQEEKAALRMEALQYLRMMEEQAEYDVEALERANDLLAERDKELQDLEYELEYYRNNYPDNDSSSLDNQAETGPGASTNPTVDKISRIPNGNCKPVSVPNMQQEVDQLG